MSTTPEDDETAQAIANDRKSAILLRAKNLKLNLPKPSGLEDEHTRDLILANRAMRQAGMATLKPLLPLLLRLKGKPYTLHNFFPFEPFFRTRMPKTTLLKTGRQVSKSSSLAAQGVIFSNSIPYFSTLYVTPLFEMIRRFSHNYVRQLIEESPVRHLFLNSKMLNSVLQRNFKNGSAMYFSYALLDAERTRGIPADKNCLVAGTMIETCDNGDIPIEEVEPYTEIVSADKNGKIVRDTITERIYSGVQDVYEVEFTNGKKVTCTADERFRKTDGTWLTLSTLFTDRFEKTCGQTINLVANATTVGLFARGRLYPHIESNSKLPNKFSTRTKTRSLLSVQSQTFKTVRKYRTNCSPKSWLQQRKNKLRSVCNSVKCLLKTDSRPYLCQRKENSNSRMVKCPNLGSCCLLVNGRRFQTNQLSSFLYSWFLFNRSEAYRNQTKNYGFTDGKTLSSEGEREDKIHYSLIRERFKEVVTTCSSVYAQKYALQINTTTSAGCLSLLPRNIPWAHGSTNSKNAGMQSERMSPTSAPTTLQRKLYGRTSSAEERKGTSTLSQNACVTTHIVKVTYVGKKEVWDLNTEKEHAFFCNDILTHNCIDEIQDMNYDFLQIIHETLSASPYGLKQYAGTPKSLDNTIEKLWQDSSQAEWVIRCLHGGCNHWNIPATDWDLFDMIGPWRRDISEEYPGIVCSQCRKPLAPRKGRWVHRFPERRWSFAGYHVPQIIMPMHYANAEKWDVLKGKEQGKANTTPTTFLNEVCGESCDSGSKLITVTELKAACVLPWACKAAEAQKHLKKYTRRVLSVDWGGGGGALRGASKTGEQKRERTSFTTLAVLGHTPDGKIDTIWGHRSVRTHDWEYEAKLSLEALKEFKCSHIIHDYSGAGEGRLVLLYQSGLPSSNIINMRYQGFGHNIMNFHEATEDHPHDWYAIDKARSIVTTCMAIKYGLIRFFKYDYQSADNPGLLEDFLALIEEKMNSRNGSDTYVIVRNPNKPDDFAHSVNMGACALWWMTKSWPNIAEAAKFQIGKEVLRYINPTAKVDWNDL